MVKVRFQTCGEAFVVREYAKTSHEGGDRCIRERCNVPRVFQDPGFREPVQLPNSKLPATISLAVPFTTSLVLTETRSPNTFKDEIFQSLSCKSDKESVF